MSDTYPTERDGCAIPVEHGRAAAVTAAHWLCLAAAPAFAVMALITAVSGAGQAGADCSSTHGGSLLSGMPLMYLLMSAFHWPPWLKLSAAPSGGGRSAPARVRPPESGVHP